MKITLSKQQWELIGKKTGWMKTAQGRTDRNQEEMDIEKQQKIQKYQKFREFMHSLDEGNPAKLEVVVHLVTTPEDTLKGATKLDQDILDKIFSKHEFNKFVVKDIENKLWKGTEMSDGSFMGGGTFVTVDGINVAKYLEKQKNTIKESQSAATQKKECNECHGMGFVYEKIKNLGTLDYRLSREPCSMCRGKGYITKEDNDSYLHSMGITPCPFEKELKS